MSGGMIHFRSDSWCGDGDGSKETIFCVCISKQLHQYFPPTDLEQVLFVPGG